MPVKKELLYPMFLECCKYTTDMFWESVFEDLAYGKLPYGTYISNNSLCCSYKDRNFSYSLNEKQDPKQLYDDVYNLLSKKLSLLSQKDKIRKKVEFFNLEFDTTEYRKSWSSIRKKNVQDLLIENYVIDMKKKHNLSLKQARYLLSVIYIGRILKVITSKDIEFEDGKVTGIEGISFTNKKIHISKEIYDTQVETTDCIIVEKSFLSDLWDKYLNSLRKLKCLV
jgi:hypothetical protein